jgi:multiple sugar transport system substrate-binding protein
VRAAGALGTAAALAACERSGGAARNDTAAPVDLTYMNFAVLSGPQSAATEQRIVKAYTDKNAKVTITDNSAGTNNSNDFFAKITSLYAAGTPPDVYALQSSRIGDFYPQGLLLDITARAAKDAKLVNKDDLFPVLWDQAHVVGKLPALPHGPATAIHIFNTDLYRQVGLKTPAEEVEAGASRWTWDRYEEAAVRLTERTPGGTYRVAHRNMSADDLAVITWANGGEVLNKEETRLLLDSAAGVEAMDYIYDFRSRRKLTITNDDLTAMGVPPGLNDPNILWAFPNNRLSNAIQGSSFISNLRQPVLDTKVSWGLAPLPAGRAGRFTRIECQLMAIAAQTTKADAAWLFANHLESAEADAMRVDDLMLEPLRKSNGKRYVELKLPGLPAGMKYVIESRDFAKPWAPRIPEWSKVNGIIGTNFNAAINGELSPKDAMTKAAAEANAILPAKR